MDIIRTKDSGKGGQHRNKTESCIVATHRPTGLQAKAAARSQQQNLTDAMTELEQRVRAEQSASWQDRLSVLRAKLVGSGQRGDKIRTYREQDNIVTNHINDNKIALDKVLAGELI